MIFCDIELAHRIDRSEQDLLLAAASRGRQRLPESMVEEVGGGLAVFIEPGSPLNKAAGLGFSAFDESKWKTIEAALAHRNASVQVELSTLADPELARWFTANDYELCGVENVLGRRCEPQINFEESPGFAITTCTPADFSQWIDATNQGFASPDDQGIQSQEVLLDHAVANAIADIVQSPGMLRYAAYVDRHIAGTGALYCHNDIAILCGAATLPAYRRRGIQSALLRRRIAAAADRGAKMVVVTTQPGSKSQQNVQRLGFELLYSRLILRRRTV